MLSTVFGTLTIWKPRKLLLYHKHENKDNFCIKTKTMWNISLFPSFVCWYFLGCIAYKCFFPAASNTKMRCFQKSIIIVQMFIDHKLVAAHAPMTFDWLVGLLVANPPRKCTFQISYKMVKAADDDPRVSTIKSPQSNPDISNGQIHQFWGDDFAANIFCSALGTSKFDRVINSRRPGVLDMLVSPVSSPGDIFDLAYTCKSYL